MMIKEYGNWTLVIPLKRPVYYLPGHLNLDDPRHTHLHFQVVHHLRHGNTIRKFYKNGDIEEFYRHEAN